MSHKYFTGYLLSLLLFTGCIDEYPDHCGTGATTVTLTYAYNFHEYFGDLFNAEVDHLHLYIYDATGNLVQQKDQSRSALTGGNSIDLYLDEGDYTIVSWGNIHTDNFLCKDIEQLETMDLNLTCVVDDVLTTPTPGSLFHGLTRIKVNGSKTVTEEVELVKNSAAIQIRINDLNEHTTINSWITGPDAHYSYDNSLHPSSRFVTYISDQETGSDYAIEKLQVFRLFADNAEATLHVEIADHSGATPVFSSIDISLISLLLLNGPEEGMDEQEFLDRRDEHKFVIKASTDGKYIVTVVEDWEDEENPTEL